MVCVSESTPVDVTYMAQINVTQFAKELGLPLALLIEQLQAAGVKKALADDTVLTEKDKTQLLDYLRAVARREGSRRTRSRSRAGRPPRSRSRTAPARRAPSRSRCARSACWSSAMRLKREPVWKRRQAAVPVIDAEQTALREAEAQASRPS